MEPEALSVPDVMEPGIHIRMLKLIVLNVMALGRFYAQNVTASAKFRRS